MTRTRKAILVALAVLNFGLLGALFHLNQPTAQAQMAYRGMYPVTNYVVMTGKIGETWDALYVIDLSTRKLAAWKWDRTTKRLVVLSGRVLDKDFKNN